MRGCARAVRVCPFHADGEPGAEIPSAELGKLAALSGVSGFPMRVKCATLVWHALHSALEGEDEMVSSE